MYKGYREIIFDIASEKSSDARLGQFLNSHKELRQAIIMAEPDYDIEALPYYSPIKIYLARKSSFGKHCHFTTLSEQTLSLGELLDKARFLNQSENRPILIAIGLENFNLEGTESQEIHYSVNRIFKWTAKELAEFKASTSVLAEFRDAKDENFILYQLNE